jgi:hypothetical protein
MFGSSLSISEMVLITEKRDLKLRCAPYLEAIEIKNKQIAILHGMKKNIMNSRFVVFTDKDSILLEACPAVRAEVILDQIELREKQRDEIYKRAYAELDSEAYAHFLEKEKELK